MDKFNARKGLALGTGKAQDTEIEVNNGAANKPKVKWNEATQKWQFSNDGIAFNDFGSGGAWGEITGTITEQTDLQTELDTKLNSADNLTDVADQQTALNNVTAVAGAMDEYVLTKDTSTGNALWKEVIFSDELLKVSANDTTAGYLEDKIVVSSGTNTTNVLEVTTLNDGIDEDLQIQIDESKIDHDNLTGVDALGSGVAYGHISDRAETIYGVKTFDSFPITPSSEPTSDYEVVNKSYVDSREFSYLISKGEIGEIKEWSWSVLPDGFLSLDGTTIAKEDYPDFFEFLILQGEITETDETYTLSTVADGIIRVEDDFNSIYEVVDSIPVGTVLQGLWDINNIPKGFIPLNGASLQPNVFPELFEHYKKNNLIDTEFIITNTSTETLLISYLKDGVVKTSMLHSDGTIILNTNQIYFKNTGEDIFVNSYQSDDVYNLEFYPYSTSEEIREISDTIDNINASVFSTVFKIQDARGLFFRSGDEDADRAIGSTQTLSVSSGANIDIPNLAVQCIIKYKLGDGRLS